MPDLDVADMRRRETAPADVIPHPIGGQAGERKVQRRDPNLGPFPVFGERAVGKRDIVHVGQKGVVDLQDQPGVENRAIFLAQRLGQAEQEFLLGLVVAEPKPRHGAGRRHQRHEALELRLSL